MRFKSSLVLRPVRQRDQAVAPLQPSVSTGTTSFQLASTLGLCVGVSGRAGASCTTGRFAMV